LSLNASFRNESDELVEELEEKHGSNLFKFSNPHLLNKSSVSYKYGYVICQIDDVKVIKFDAV
jgi:hypothetical protein